MALTPALFLTWLCLLVACSSKSGQPVGMPGVGGTAGRAEAGVPDAGGASVDALNMADAGGAMDVPTVPANPLCPGGVLTTPSATPLPDGVQVLADTTGARNMIVAGAYAYWTTETAIRRVPIGGGPTSTVLDRATARNHLGWLAVDGPTLYFSETGIYNAFGLAKMPADGSGAPTIIATGNSIWNVVFSDGYVYYYDAGSQELARVSAAGGPSTVLVRGVSPTDLMAVANGFLYFIDPRSNSFDVHLWRVPVDAQASPVDGGAPNPDAGSSPGGAQIVTTTDNYDTYGVVADGTNLFWDEDNRVKGIPQAGGAAVTLDEEPDHSGSLGLASTTYIGSVAAGGGSVYWSIEVTCSDIVRSTSSGAQKTTIVHAVNFPTQLTLDSTHVYFLAGGRQLLRAPR